MLAGRGETAALELFDGAGALADHPSDLVDAEVPDHAQEQDVPLVGRELSEDRRDVLEVEPGEDVLADVAGGLGVLGGVCGRGGRAGVRSRRRESSIRLRAIE